MYESARARGGIGGGPEALLCLKNETERIFPGTQWFVAGIGKYEIQLATLAIVLGGHVRVGLEDNIYLSKGVFAKSNAELVEKVVRVAKELGREIADPVETRRMLGLEGSHLVGF